MSSRKLKPHDPFDDWIRLRETEAVIVRDLKFLFRPKPVSATTSRRSDTTATRNKVDKRQRVKDTLADVDYLQRRAEQEVDQAQEATDPAVVAIHYELAEEYLERVQRLGPSGK